MAEWNVDAASQVLREHFAPWVQALDLAVESVSPQRAALRMRFHEALCREGGILSGQALAALADTAMVFAVASACDGYRPMATVDLHTTFLRAVARADVVAEAEVTRLGRTLAFARVSMRAIPLDADSRIDRAAAVATAVATFALA